jgi:hypothetical protein
MKFVKCTAEIAKKIVKEKDADPTYQAPYRKKFREVKVVFRRTT